MSQTINLPDIGEFDDVPIVEIMVALGDTIAKEEPILMLESDKATFEVPSPISGKIVEILVAEGDTISQGDPILIVDVEQDNTVTEPHSASTGSSSDHHAELVVLGAGPGGYSAAFRAADLGKSVILIDRWPTLGGACLNVGCIPSKALLHLAKVIDEAEEADEMGLSFGAPKLDLDKARGWKDGVIRRLTSGIAGLAKRRKVTVLRGTGQFAGPKQIVVENDEGSQTVSFDSAIIAVGSEPARLPFLPDDPQIIDSTGALALEDVPARMLVLGGGIIGMELGQVYQRFGSEVSVVEMMPQLIPGADKDIVAPLMKRFKARFMDIMLATKVTKVEATKAGLTVTFEKDNEAFQQEYDKILVAVGRTPNGGKVNADQAGVYVDERGFIPVDKQMRSNISHIYAIGDVVGQPMLAHKAAHEGHVAAEVLAGHKVGFDALAIPSVAYCDPEVAWVGLTETRAKAEGIKVKKGSFPWMASGRSLSMGRDDGLTKLLFDPDTKRVLGAGIVGQGAGDLIAEIALAIEMGCDVDDIALTVHPHPTLSETVGLAAEIVAGTITDL